MRLFRPSPSDFIIIVTFLKPLKLIFMFGVEQFKLLSVLVERDISLVNVRTNNKNQPFILK